MIFGRQISALLSRRAEARYTVLPDGLNRTPASEKHGSRSRIARAVIYTALGLSLIGAVAVFSRSHGRSLSTTPSPQTSHEPPRPSRAELSKDQYIDAILRDPVEGLLDLEPIRKKCNETQYQPGLIWHCDTVVGGIGNVANMWLNCVRYAIEAGATTLILPRLGARGNDLIDLGNKDHSVELTYLFDVNYFLQVWDSACPQILAAESEDDIPNLPPPERTLHLAPARLKQFPMRKYLIVDPTGWREALDKWLGDKVPGNPVSGTAPVRVWQDMVLAQWNREVDSREFGVAFPRLFRFQQQTRRLAAATLWGLEKKLGRPVVPDAILLNSTETSPPPASSTVNSLGPGRLVSDAFLGAHMRVAADAVAAGWPGYDAQAPFFIAEAKKRNLTNVFLATGSDEHRDKFRVDAQAQGLQVTTKEDVLSKEETAQLKALTWDQQAVVDFEVLMHSSWFYGAVRSSFSWSLVLRRGTLPEAGSSLVTKDGGDEYRDSLSAVVGRYPNINPEGLWP